MDYYGLLFLYYLKGLSGKSILRLFFNIEAGGTEQLLPENSSTPTTTPILADIQYPDGLRTDQYFTYRETPTTISNKARIKTIKGNTLVWNQLVRNGNFVDTSYWNGNGTKTVSNNELTYTKPARWNSLSNSQLINLVSGHKYLAMFEAYCENDTMSVFWQTGTGTGNAVYTIPSGASWQKYSLILTSAQTTTSGRVLGFDNNSAQETIFHLRNYMFIDLTMMGLDSMTLDEVKEWLNAYYPLPYYDYNQGSLLSFNGNGIKTVGKNRFNKDAITLNSRIAENGQIYSSSASDLTDYIDVGAFDSVNFSWDYSSLSSSDSRAYVKFDMGKNVVSFATYSPTSKSVSIDTSSCFYLRITLDKGMKDVQVENEQKTSYEPYTSSTLSLPISTYFPNGMDGVGDIHDELTSSSYAKKFSTVTVDGSENWTKSSSYEGNYYARILGNAKLYIGKAVNTFTRNVARNTQELAQYDNCIFIDGESSRQTLNIKNSSISTLENFKSWLASNPVTVCYELVNPIENYGVVDLGTLEWRLGVYNELYTTISDMEKGVANVLPSVLCSKYQTIIFASRSQWTTPVITVPDDQNLLQVRNTGITDPAEFKTAVSGVYLLYEKDSTETTPEEANEALSLLMGKSVSSNNAKQMIGIITKGE